MGWAICCNTLHIERLLCEERFFLLSLFLYSYSLNFQEFKVGITSKEVHPSTDRYV